MIPRIKADQPAMFRYGRWSLARDGFGVVSDPEGNYVYTADAIEAIHACRVTPAQPPSASIDAAQRERIIELKLALDAANTEKEDLQKEVKRLQAEVISVRAEWAAETKGACPVCGCEELDHRGLWTCRCPWPSAMVRKSQHPQQDRAPQGEAPQKPSNKDSGKPK